MSAEQERTTLTHRLGDADVRLYILGTDSDLPAYMGGLAEVRTEDTTRMHASEGGRWSPTHDEPEALRDRDYLVFETGLGSFDDVEPHIVPALRHRLEQIALARRIATKAHEGLTDKLGEPYIAHPRRVATRVGGLDEQAVAWLHDVVEDTGTTAEDLRSAGIDEEVVAAVVLLTRTDSVTADEYYARIATSPLARAVKLADIADNTDPERTTRLDPVTRKRLAEKYRNAMRALRAKKEHA